MSEQKTIGRYEILEQLGSGAMGIVYRAKDPAMDRIVALKTITVLALASDQGGQLRERFFREARAAGGLSHPGIVSIFDVGEHEGVPYLVMEFVSGRTLSETLKRGERPAIDRVCEIGQQVAEALDYAHRRGVVHRDIKPANILLTSRDTHGVERPKIADFGVAKLSEGQTTMTGQMLGTPAFMPPEQFTGAPIDGRADLFSLGVMLYWMAVGELPFPGESLTSVSYKVVHTDPPPPRRLNPSIPLALEDVILKCMAKGPADRYQTGEELATALADLRAAAGTNLRPRPVMQTTMAGDPEATLIETRPATTMATTSGTIANPTQNRPAPTDAPAQQRPAAPLLSSKQYGGLLALVAIAVVIAGSGWLIVWRRGQEKPPTAASASATATAPLPAAPASPAAAAPAPVAADAGAKKTGPSAAAVNAAAAAAPTSAKAKKSASDVTARAGAATAAAAASSPASTPAAAPAAPAPPPAPAPPAMVDFDPATLNAKNNAKLRIDADRTPFSLDFSIEMNGKTYFHRSVGTNASVYENLFVPPGVQEFRVVARNGAVQKISNTVSAEFEARKRKTLTIELRTQGAPADQMPQGLYPDSQIVLTLK